jgi:hypothetical protein
MKNIICVHIRYITIFNLGHLGHLGIKLVFAGFFNYLPRAAPRAER